ncbi:hypothetical protein GQX74_013062 [Glossina fuscipes]|nr:hypothetical protein GQX74_013062 [Glossina fuscipes]
MNIPHKYSRIEINNNNNNNNDNNGVYTNKHYIACDGIYYSGEIYFIVARVVCYVTVEHGAENSDSFSNVDVIAHSGSYHPLHFNLSLPNLPENELYILTPPQQR